MAWYTPKHSCGHTSPRVQLYGHHSGREAYLDREERFPCPDCRAAAAQIAAKDAGIPVLTGSPKQVGWASQIRDKEITRLRETVGGDRADQYMAAMLPHSEAKWWIDNRYDLTGAVKGLVGA